MSEDGENTEPKTYSEDEMTEAISKSEKEGAAKSWSHFQSIADKEIAKERAEHGTRESELTKTIDTMKADAIGNLPESERLGAMVEELYKDRHGEKSSSPAPDSKSTSDTEVDQASYAKEMQEQIGGALKELGLDPTKVNWGDGKDGKESLKTFLGSVVEQVRGQDKDSADDDEKDEKSGDAKSGESKVDTSRGAGSVSDVTQVKPIDLVTSDGWKPIRGGMEEG